MQEKSNKISNIKERILYSLELKGITKSTFFEKIGMTYGNFTGKSKETPLNSDAIGNILLEMPDINVEWLLTGKGEMLKNSNNNIGSGQQIIANGVKGSIHADNRQYYSDSPDVLRAQIDEKDRLLQEKEERIKEKDAQIKEKDAQINKLLDILHKQ